MIEEMMVLGTDSLLAILLTLVPELRAANSGGMGGCIPRGCTFFLFFLLKSKLLGGFPPIFNLHPPNNFDFSKKKVIKKFWRNGVEKHESFYPQTRSLGIIPQISKNSPKYADHPPNAGHGLAALPEL